MAEQLIRNQQVGGSNPPIGSTLKPITTRFAWFSFFLHELIITLSSPKRRHNFKAVARLVCFSDFRAMILKKMGDGLVETMSQQDMQKVMEGLRVLVEWLQRGKEPVPPQKVDGIWSNIPEVLQVNELAEVLNVSRWTAYELCRRPHFPAVRIGRRILVRKDQLQAWLDLQVKYNEKMIL